MEKQKRGMGMRFWKRIKFLFKFHKSIPFLKDYFLSKEVSTIRKLFAILLGVLYIVFPFDAIPDYLIAFGVIDDVVVVTLILQQIVRMAPESIRQKHRLDFLNKWSIPPFRENGSPLLSIKLRVVMLVIRRPVLPFLLALILIRS